MALALRATMALAALALALAAPAARRHGMDDDFYATAERDATKSLWEGINDVKEQLLVPALRLPLDDKVTASELREKHMRSPKEFFQENMKGWQVR